MSPVLVQAAVAVILLLSALIPTSQATTPPDPGATTCIRDAPPLTFDQSHWLWTAEMASGYGYIGTRAFRKTFVTPPGKTAVLAEIIMNGDDDFMLYVNGDTIGGASSWPDTKRFCMALRPDVNMFAATVHTAAQLVAGLLGTIQITYSDNSTTTIVTDSSWRVTTGAPAGFERPEFDDGAWPAASSFWQYPAGDWGAFFVPSAEKVECKNVKPDTCACKNDCKKATNPCSSFEDASCRPPIENGVQVCGPSITSTTECALKCNPGFESHGETCVPKCKPGLALDKEGTCVAETSEVFKDFCASGGFLSAVKGVGCKCLPEKTSEWCDDTVIGGGVRSCFSDAAATVVECRVSRCAGDPGTAPHVPIAPGTYQIQNKQTNIWLTNDVSAKQITVEAQENPPAATQVWKLEPQPGGSYHVSTTIGDETQYLYAPNGAPPVASTTQRTYFYIERRRPNAHFFMRPVDLCPVLVVENGQKLVTRGIDANYACHPCWDLIPVTLGQVSGAEAVSKPSDSKASADGDGVTSVVLSTVSPPELVCSEPVKDGRKECGPRISISKTCTIECNKGAELTDGKCIVTARNETKSELECGADAGSVGFLSADPIRGCICETEKKDTFCGAAFGDEDAEMMCSDTTDAAGKREVKCAVKCSETFTAKDQNTCEKIEVEGDSVTMAGTAKPRDSEEVACSDKVFRLPGKGGCKCASEAPAGATECPGVGPKEYAICQYEQGSGEEASCTTECIKGAYKKGPAQLCG